jgi:anti-sigma regulatory factor (Ser/Thr protein kinase)
MATSPVISGCVHPSIPPLHTVAQDRQAYVPRATSAARARHHTRTVLERWLVPPDVVEQAELVVSELVTNAVVHTFTCCVVLTLGRIDDERVRIAVTDRQPGARTLEARAAYPDSESGRGLALVSSIAESWGLASDHDETTVWALLPGGAWNAANDEPAWAGQFADS